MCFKVYIPDAPGFFHFYCFLFPRRSFSLAMRSKKPMCKNQAMLLYSYILLDLPLPFFCQKNMEERGRGRGMREKGRMKTGLPRRNPGSDFQTGGGLRTGRSRTSASPLKSKVVHGADGASQALDGRTGQNSMSAPQKTSWGASLRWMLPSSSQMRSSLSDAF